MFYAAALYFATALNMQLYFFFFKLRITLYYAINSYPILRQRDPSHLKRSLQPTNMDGTIETQKSSRTDF